MMKAKRLEDLIQTSPKSFGIPFNTRILTLRDHLRVSFSSRSDVQERKTATPLNTSTVSISCHLVGLPSRYARLLGLVHFKAWNLACMRHKYQDSLIGESNGDLPCTIKQNMHLSGIQAIS